MKSYKALNIVEILVNKPQTDTYLLPDRSNIQKPAFYIYTPISSKMHVPCYHGLSLTQLSLSLNGWSLLDHRRNKRTA